MAIYSTLPAITTVSASTLFGSVTNTLPVFPQTFSNSPRLKPVNLTLHARAYLNAYVASPTNSVWLADGIRNLQWSQKDIRISPFRAILNDNSNTNIANYYGFNFYIGWGLKIQTTDLTANIANPVHQHENGDDMNYAPMFYNLGLNKSLTWHSSKYHAQPWGEFKNQDLQLSFGNSINTINGDGNPTAILTGVSSLLVYVNIAGGGTNHQVPVNTPEPENVNIYYKIHFLDPITFAPKPLSFTRAGETISLTGGFNNFIMVTSIFYNLADQPIFDSSSTSLLTKLTISNFNTDNRKLFKIDYNFNSINGTYPLTVCPSVIWDGNLDNPNIITNATPQVAVNHIGLNQRMKLTQGRKWIVRVKIKDFGAYNNLSLSATDKAVIQTGLNYEKNYDSTNALGYQNQDNLYWFGKVHCKMTDLAILADNISDLPARTLLLNKIRPKLIERLSTLTDGRRLRYTNTNGHAFIQAANILDHSVDEFYNYSGSDRNIHIGLFLKMCAFVSKYDNSFKTGYKDRIDLLCASIANTSTDSNFVFTSIFDWLSFAAPLSGMNGGTSDGTSGESQAESFNMGIGIKEWGEVTNNDFLRDWGLLMFSMEVDSFAKYRIVDPATLPSDRCHISTFYNSKKINLVARIGEGQTQLDDLYFYPNNNRWYTHYVWGINWLALIPSMQKVGVYTPNLGNLIANFYDSPQNGMPILYQIENPGVTITAGVNVFTDISNFGETAPINNLLNKLKITVGASGVTDIGANNGNNLSTTLSLKDNTVYDLISPNVSGAKVRIFTKPFYKANDWTWGIRSDAIRAITPSVQLDIFTKLKNLSRATNPSAYTFDPITDCESPTILLSVLANQIDNKVEFVTANNVSNPVTIDFKSVFNADSYAMNIYNSSNLIVQTKVIEQQEYNVASLVFSASVLNTLPIGVYTASIQPKSKDVNIGTMQTMQFTTGSFVNNNPLGGVRNIRVRIS